MQQLVTREDDGGEPDGAGWRRWEAACSSTDADCSEYCEDDGGAVAV